MILVQQADVHAVHADYCALLGAALVIEEGRPFKEDTFLCQHADGSTLPVSRADLAHAFAKPLSARERIEFPQRAALQPAFALV